MNISSEIKAAAEAGDAVAQYRCGMHLLGEYGGPKDSLQATHWLLKSANQGHVDAQHTLGWIYLEGDGVQQDIDEGIRWFKVAAEQGDSNAQFELGMFYANGDYVQCDSSEAVKWYRLAAAQGNGMAVYELESIEPFQNSTVGVGVKFETMGQFFTNLFAYMDFLLNLKETKRASSDLSCIATLKKENGSYLYDLAWKDGKFVSEYVRPFRASEENLQIFNAGCVEIERRLKIFLETRDSKLVPMSPPAFGVLSFEQTEENAPSRKTNRTARNQKYFPAVEKAREVRRYEDGGYTIVLLSDVECGGNIECPYLLVAFKNGENEPSYVIAAEKNNFTSVGEKSGSHFLGVYPGSGHRNLGCSDDWSDLLLFEKKAREVMFKDLNFKIHEPK